MTTIMEPTFAPTTEAGPELLERLQLRVARRADAIARRIGGRREHQRTIWLRAEQEVFEDEERARPLRGQPG